jgi:hypothetical protein
MNFEEVIAEACDKPTLHGALTYAAVWESERVIPVAHEFLSGRKPVGPNGQGWDSCFSYLIRHVLEEWPKAQVIKRLKGKI